MLKCRFFFFLLSNAIAFKPLLKLVNLIGQFKSTFGNLNPITFHSLPNLSPYHLIYSITLLSVLTSPAVCIYICHVVLYSVVVLPNWASLHHLTGSVASPVFSHLSCQLGQCHSRWTQHRLGYPSLSSCHLECMMGHLKLVWPLWLSS